MKALPDPETIPVEDVRNTLVSVKSMAGDVDFASDAPQRIFVVKIPGQGLVRGKNPRVEDGKVVLDIHEPGPPQGGPQLGQAPAAIPPA